MERRTVNIIIQAPGGTASKGSSTYKISLPSSWIKEMGITEENKQVELSFDGTSIHITRKLSIEEFISLNQNLNHELYLLSYFDDETLCSRIVADYTTKSICFEDCVDHFIHTAFGNNLTPTWGDYEAFLESRCLPKTRAGLREYLETIGVAAFNPLAIIQKTGGRMAEDHQWLTVEAIK